MKTILRVMSIAIFVLMLSTTVFGDSPVGVIGEEETEVKKDFTASKELEKKLIDQTVSIIMVDRGIGSCSGTIVSENKYNHYVLTAKHCIDVTEEMYVEKNEVLFIITSANDDLALIAVDGKIPGKTIAKLALTDAIVDDTVHHIAYPSGIMYKMSGKVTRNTKDWQWLDFMAIGGCSGGGIFNEEGELVSVLWGGYSHPKPKSPIKSVSEPLKDIKKFLKTIGMIVKDN